MTEPHPDANADSSAHAADPEQQSQPQDSLQVPVSPQYPQQPQGFPQTQPQFQQLQGFPQTQPQFQQPQGLPQAPSQPQYPQYAQPQQYSSALAQPQYQQQPQGYAAPPQYQQHPPVPNPAYGYPQPKSKIVAGLLGIFLGGLGIHRFYLGFTKIAVIQLILTLVLGAFTFGIVALWGVVEGIMIIAGAAHFQRDAHGTPLRD